MEVNASVVTLYHEQLQVKSPIKKYEPRIEETILDDKPIKLFVCFKRAKPVIDKQELARLVQYIFTLFKSNFELEIENDDSSICYEYDPQSETNNISMIIFPKVYLASKWYLYQLVAYIRKRFPDSKLGRRIDLSRYLETHVTHEGIILGENDNIERYLCTKPHDSFQVLDMKKLFHRPENNLPSSPRIIVVIDVETNDWRPGAQLDANDNSPFFDRAVQIAWAIFDCNSPQKSITEACYYVTPDRFKISDKARALHSISNHQLEQEGRPFNEIMFHLKSDIETSAREAPVVLVSHHLEFDKGVIIRELRLRGCEIDPFSVIRESIDTFDPEYLRIFKPQEYANRRFGLKLADSLQVFGGKDVTASTKGDLLTMCHNALADVKMAALVYFGLRDLSLVD